MSDRTRGQHGREGQRITMAAFISIPISMNLQSSASGSSPKSPRRRSSCKSNGAADLSSASQGVNIPTVALSMAPPSSATATSPLTSTRTTNSKGAVTRTTVNTITVQHKALSKTRKSKSVSAGASTPRPDSQSNTNSNTATTTTTRIVYTSQTNQAHTEKAARQKRIEVLMTPPAAASIGVLGSTDSDSELIWKSSAGKRSSRRGAVAPVGATLLVTREKVALDTSATDEDELSNLAAANTSAVSSFAPNFPRKRRNSSQGPAADAFRKYMNEISPNELLERTQEMALAQQVKELVRCQKARESLRQSLGRAPSIAEWAEELKFHDPSELLRVIQNGTRAKNQLVTSNMRLVQAIARANVKKAGRISFDDLVQEGAMGLMRAAEKFEVSRGWRFSTYATWWIRAAILRSIDSQERPIRVPSRVLEDFRMIRKAFARFATENGMEPTDEELAFTVNMPVDRMRFIVEAATRQPSSADSPIKGNARGRDETVSLIDFMKSNDDTDANMVDEMLRSDLDKVLLKHLNPQERAVLRLRFGLEDGLTRTLEEVGSALNLSRERIRQVIFSALKKLRNPKIRSVLEEYL